MQEVKFEAVSEAVSFVRPTDTVGKPGKILDIANLPSDLYIGNTRLD